MNLPTDDVWLKEVRMKKTRILGLMVFSALLTFLPAVASAITPPIAWTRTYDSGSDDTATCCGLVTDAAGNVIVTGTFYNGTDSDIRTIKYDSNGVELWNVVFDSGVDDRGNCCGSVMVDSAGDVIVTGSADDSITGQTDFLVLKYDSAGVLLWSQRYTVGNSGGWPCGAVVDSADNVIVFGSFYNGANQDYCTVKYDSAGTLLWAQTYDSGYDDRCGSQIAVDSADNILVGGTSYNGLNDDVRILKYDPSGGLLWNMAYDSGDTDYGWSAAVDSADNVVVAGSTGSWGSRDILVLKYNPAGTLLWSRNYDAGANESGVGIAVDSADNIITAGWAYGTTEDYCTAKVDPAGNLLWIDLYDSGVDDIWGSIALDSGDNIAVTGYAASALSDYHTVKYDTGGTRLWAAIYDGGDDDWTSAVAVDTSDNVIVFGSSFNGTDYDFRTVKYAAGNAGTISGFVTDTSYTPIPGARVNLFQGPVLSDSTFTNPAGHYEFTGLADGRYRVVAGKPGYGRDMKAGRVQQAAPWGREEFLNFILP
jgi:uncharacterized delta-60 repeat protein